MYKKQKQQTKIKTFWETKKKHLHICYYLLKGSFVLLSNVRFADPKEGLRIINAFDGSKLVRDFLFNLTNYWFAEETLETYGMKSDELQGYIEDLPIEDWSSPQPSIHAPLSGETNDYYNILQTMSPIEKHRLELFVRKPKNTKH